MENKCFCKIKYFMFLFLIYYISVKIIRIIVLWLKYINELFILIVCMKKYSIENKVIYLWKDNVINLISY